MEIKCCNNLSQILYILRHGVVESYGQRIHVHQAASRTSSRRSDPMHRPRHADRQSDRLADRQASNKKLVKLILDLASGFKLNSEAQQEVLSK